MSRSALTRQLVAEYPRFGESDAYDMGVLQCHEMVMLGEALPVAKRLRAVRWDEHLWGAVMKKIQSDKKVWSVVFPAGPVHDILEDVASGSVNGHSFFLTYGGRIVDPYLELLGASASDVQRSGKYLLKVYRSVGMNWRSGGA